MSFRSYNAQKACAPKRILYHKTRRLLSTAAGVAPTGGERGLYNVGGFIIRQVIRRNVFKVKVERFAPPRDLGPTLRYVYRYLDLLIYQYMCDVRSINETCPRTQRTDTA